MIGGGHVILEKIIARLGSNVFVGWEWNRVFVPFVSFSSPPPLDDCRPIAWVGPIPTKESEYRAPLMERPAKKSDCKGRPS